MCIRDRNTTLYAVWGLNYAYNSGNQYTSNTGGWTYTRTFLGQSNVNAVASETTSFTSSYIQWSETDSNSDWASWEQNGSGHGAGYFQHSRLVHMYSAKTINFHYTLSQYNGSIYGAYYPSLTFQILKSSCTVISTRTEMCIRDRCLDTKYLKTKKSERKSRNRCENQRQNHVTSESSLSN